MAQTRRKRKRRHRGTQAGTIERAGRTSKPAAGAPRKSSSASSSSGGSSRQQLAREKREQRMNTPPTWRGAVNRAGFAAAILVVFIAVVQKNIAAGLVMGVLALLIYLPMSYYTDLALYRRRQRRKQATGR
jgi:Flp pilus assembly protein TadB